MNENRKSASISIKQLLNHSLEQLDQSTLDGLFSARMNALHRYKAHSVPLPLFAWVGEHVIGHASPHRNRLYYWVSAIVLAISLFGSIAYWQQAMDNDTSEEDIAILTGDLPIQYYVE